MSPPERPEESTVVVDVRGPPVPSAADLRRFLDFAFVRLDHHHIDAIHLVCEELLANAIRHGGGPSALRVIRVPDAVRVEVDDLDPADPTVLPPDPARIGGRGMVLIQALCRRWGVDHHRGHKTVWAVVADERTRRSD